MPAIRLAAAAPLCALLADARDGCGFGRALLECDAGGGVFFQRGVVSRLARERGLFVSSIKSAGPPRQRGLGGRQFAIETRAPVAFLGEQVRARPGARSRRPDRSRRVAGSDAPLPLASVEMPLARRRRQSARSELRFAQ
jgi:hypothetical protein